MQGTLDLPRAIALERASNLRDLGGWPTIDGGRVRHGLIFRVPALLALSDADRAAVAALGIRTAVDFPRRGGAGAPSRFPGGRGA